MSILFDKLILLFLVSGSSVLLSSLNVSGATSITGALNVSGSACLFNNT